MYRPDTCRLFSSEEGCLYNQPVWSSGGVDWWWVAALGTLWKCHSELSDLTTGYLGRLSALWSGVLISNCFALSPIRRLSLAKNGELVVTGNTATTNLLLLSLMIISSPNCSLFQVTSSIPLLTAEQLEGIKLTTKRLSREKFDP